MASASVNILTEATLNLRVGEGAYRTNVETIVGHIYPRSDRKMASTRSRLRTVLARGEGVTLEELPAEDKRDGKDDRTERKKIRQRIDELVELREAAKQEKMLRQLAQQNGQLEASAKTERRLTRELGSRRKREAAALFDLSVSPTGARGEHGHVWNQEGRVVLLYIQEYRRVKMNVINRAKTAIATSTSDNWLLTTAIAEASSSAGLAFLDGKISYMDRSSKWYRRVTVTDLSFDKTSRLKVLGDEERASKAIKDMSDEDLRKLLGPGQSVADFRKSGGIPGAYMELLAKVIYPSMRSEFKKAKPVAGCHFPPLSRVVMVEHLRFTGKSPVLPYHVDGLRYPQNGIIVYVASASRDDLIRVVALQQNSNSKKRRRVRSGADETVQPITFAMGVGGSYFMGPELFGQEQSPYEHGVFGHDWADNDYMNILLFRLSALAEQNDDDDEEEEEEDDEDEDEEDDDDDDEEEEDD